ncbi:VP4 [CHeRI orbivirus 1]|nr:VP4 [CHeRI orbivirus 1]
MCIFAHAVIYVARGFEQQLSGVFLPVIRFTGRETLEQLWRLLGQYNTDIYVTGSIIKWSIRQLRAMNFIFVARRGQTITIRGGDAPIDITYPVNYPKDSLAKDFETKLGVERIHLRKKFGNILRTWTMKFAVEFHGSEAETLMTVNPRRHRVYGLPELPPGIGIPSLVTMPYLNDSGTDEKLISMLDYMVCSCDVVYYVGCGDLRTLLRFGQKDNTRFARTTWVCIDPIVPPSPMPNIVCINAALNNPSELRALKRPGGNLEHLLLWDVRTERGTQDAQEWDITTRKEDTAGAYMAMLNKDWLSLACIKSRIPTGHTTSFTVYTSFLTPQPSAAATMFELRSILRLCGFSHIDRSHIPEARELLVSHADCCTLVQNFHGVARGKKLKRALMQYIHIQRKNGLDHTSNLPRVDLFYLTNIRNKKDIDKINVVLRTSALATVWIGPETLTGYDDFSYNVQALMLRYSSNERMVLDGNGFILYMMWKDLIGADPRTVSYDPSWAMKFGVVSKRCYGLDIVPDLSLCRFIGLRRLSTEYRLNTDYVHKRADLLKRLGLDVSGHLFVTLVSGAYCFDLTWWIKMIKEWSTLSEAHKLAALEHFHAEVIEWREENADQPWHRPEDLAAALSLVSTMNLPVVCEEDFTPWIQMLR